MLIVMMTMLKKVILYMIDGEFIKQVSLELSKEVSHFLPISLPNFPCKHSIF